MKTLQELREQAKKALLTVERAGIKSALVHCRITRRYNLKTKNEAIELLKEALDLQLSLSLFDHHRFGWFATSDMSEEGLKRFVQKSAEMVRLTDADPAHGLPDKEFTRPLPMVNLELCDPVLVQSKKGEGLRLCQRMTQAAKSFSPEIIHVEAGFNESHHRSVSLSSEGFSGEQESTMFNVWCDSFVRDGERKQSEYDYGYWRHWSELTSPEAIGRASAQRVLAIKGSTPIKTGKYSIVLANYRCADFIGKFLSAFAGREVYRKTSCLHDKLNQAIAPQRLTLIDNPLIKRSAGSQLYDDEGIVARPIPLVEKGVLKNFYFDSYWARKQGVKPTTGEQTNITFGLGTRSGEEMVQDLDEGLWVTNYIGGNFNTTSGDFSVGIRGFLIKDGTLGQPITEMNLAGNLLEFLQQLEEVGNDPFAYDSVRTPSLRFREAMVSGT